MWDRKFKEVMDIKDGVVRTSQSPSARKLLAMHINDNVYKNIKHFSVTSFDATQKFSKGSFSSEEKKTVANLIVEQLDCKEQLNESIDKILLTHRNTKLFFVLMSGPFFIILSLVKYSIKLAIFYFFFMKSKKAKTE